MDPVAVQYIRGDLVESVHRASVAVTDSRGRIVASFGNPRLVTYLRSAAKPMQLIPLIETGAADRFQFTPRELAIMAGSHSGEEAHVAVVQGVLAKIGLGPQALQCGRHAPYNKEAAEKVGSHFTALHHNCSGKHSGMLALAVHNGWDPTTYLAATNGVQASILKAVSEETGVKAPAIRRGIDGCGVVTFGIPLQNGARSFARLTSPATVEGRRGETLRRIRDAMLQNPHFVAGTGRLDTDFMETLGGRLIVKAGAEACYGAGLSDQGRGIIIKVEDGNARPVGPILMQVLEQLGAMNGAAKKKLAIHWNEPVKNVAGRDVGRVECVMRLKLRSAETMVAA